MKILAIDTATEACSAAVLMPERLASRYEEVGRGHSERILAMVDAVLGEAGVALADLDAVAFGRGPGSFTGVRLAASVAQGLAFGAGLPVVPVSNLQALAQRALESAGARSAASLLVCADARMKEVYWGCFERSAPGAADAHAGARAEADAGATATAAHTGAHAEAHAEVHGDGERVGPPASVELPADLAAPVHGVGRGFLAYPELAVRLAGRLQAVHADLLPRAEEVARLAATELAAGRSVAPWDIVPTYLRDDVARPPRN
jgi:tRNA threonylcarbamoyladenosine biosynthesis protein TsaB